MEERDLFAFIEEGKGLSMKQTTRLVQLKQLATQEWLEVHRLTKLMHQTHNLRVAAMRRAVELANTFEDWVCIAECAKQPYRNMAYDKLLEFEITSDEQVARLNNSTSERLHSVGWYLAGRRKQLGRCN